MHEGPDFVFYNIWERRKNWDHTATNRAINIRLVTEDIMIGWCHEVNHIWSSPRNFSRDFNGYVRVPKSISRMKLSPNDPYKVGGSSNDPNVEVSNQTTLLVSNSDNLTAVWILLEDTVVLSPGDPAMSMEEMLDFVHRRVIRSMRQLLSLIFVSNHVIIVRLIRKTTSILFWTFSPWIF